MDYDKTAMPSAYDAGRGYSAAALATWLEVISRQIRADSVSKILDLGCGTGRFSGALAEHLGAKVVGVDPSEKMLAEAVRKADKDVAHVRATAEALPLADRCVDVVFISMVFHHFRDCDLAMRECHRVLRPDGTLCIRAGTTEQIDHYAYVPFFKRTLEILPSVLTSRATIEAAARKAGFIVSHHELVDSENAPDWSAYAAKLSYRADSVIVRLTEQEFREGMAALRNYAATAPRGIPVTEPVDFFSFTRTD